ncbi:MAG: hypothetical protein ACRD59_12165 [Candidatus Acidiferrales bacterium]
MPKTKKTEAGPGSKKYEKEQFIGLMRRLLESIDHRERKRLKCKLARMTFG